MYLFIFRERGREGGREGEKQHTHPQLETWPTTQAWALTGNQTCDLSVCRPALNPLSHRGQGPAFNSFGYSICVFSSLVSCNIVHFFLFGCWSLHCVLKSWGPARGQAFLLGTSAGLHVLRGKKDAASGSLTGSRAAFELPASSPLTLSPLPQSCHGRPCSEASPAAEKGKLLTLGKGSILTVWRDIDLNLFHLKKKLKLPSL